CNRSGFEPSIGLPATMQRFARPRTSPPGPDAESLFARETFAGERGSAVSASGCETIAQQSGAETDRDFRVAPALRSLVDHRTPMVHRTPCLRRSFRRFGD